MSAVRVGHGVYVDPWTRMEINPDVPQPLPVVPEAPVFRRKATPEELARFDGPARPVVDSIGLIPRPIRGRYTDAEKSERRVKALRAAATRGAEATSRRYPRPNLQRHADDIVVAAVVAHHGNRNAAARALGLADQVVHRRIAFIKACGRLPAEVSEMIAGRRGGMR